MQDTDSKKIQTLINAGFDFHQQGLLDDAEPLYEEALKIDSNNAELYNLIGVLNFQKGEIEQALDNVKKAIGLCQSEYFYETLFQILIRKEDYTGIINNESVITKFYPENFSLLFGIALAYKKLYKHTEALKYYEKALRINPTSYEGWSNVANIYDIEGRTKDAISAMEVCHSLMPNDDDTEFFLAKDYFKDKNYKKGFPLFEKRSSRKIAFISQSKTLPDKVREDNFWKGENIKNKSLYVYYEAGYGDAIMYARYLPLAAKRCKKLTFMCHKGLTSLFELNKKHLGYDEIVDTYIPNAPIDADVHASLISLPYLLGLKGNDIFVSPEGYIVPDMKTAEEYRQKYFNNNKIKVGIKWRGNTTFDKDRVIPTELFNQLIDKNNAQYYSFQTYEGSEEVEKLHNIIDIGKNLTEFSQTAAALKNLDLVICNDTSLAHLAGAMRIPCWILLPYNVDWRWGKGEGQSYWYDSVKLFRQKAINDWQSVFDQIHEEMKPE